MTRDVVVIGGGHNGLIAAAYLAKAGLKPLVLERSDRVGGCAITGEIAPGFRGPTLAHRAALDPAVARDLDLARHGLRIVRSDVVACAPGTDGTALTLWRDPARAVADIGRFSDRDARQYPAFQASVSAIGRVLRRLLSRPAPSIDRPSAGELLDLLATGRQFRALGRADAYRLLRWLPMPVADLAGEWFESDRLRATVVADGLLGSFLGPRSAGSAAILLLMAARDGEAIAGGWAAHGGTGAVTDALATAARSAGAEIRTGACVRQILVDDGAVRGVVLATGEEIPAARVVSGADPKRTLLGLVDPVHLAPGFRQAVEGIRMRGALAKVNLALSALPRFTSLARFDAAQQSTALSGCVRLGETVDAIERAFDAAKYGGYSDEPWLEVTFPSIADSTLAPAGQHVASVYVQFMPPRLRTGSWDAERERLGNTVARHIETFAPGFERTILARQIITPLDLERDHGLTGGHIFHGELALDQLLLARPLLGWARHATPVRNLYLCGTGAHPGTGLDGRTGTLAAREVLRSIRGGH
jgi:phytoene dehydrogenase-like protein